MATKDLSGKELNLFGNRFISQDKRYQNLNLSDFYVNDVLCSDVVPKSFEKQKSFQVESDNGFKKADFKWKNSSSWCSSPLFTDLQTTEKEFQFGKKASSNSSSTLSIHIAAYENNNVVTCQTDSKKKNGFNSTPISTFYEFPRQQKEETSIPEVMRFKPRQKMRNTNEKAEKVVKKGKMNSLTQEQRSKLLVMKYKRAPHYIEEFKTLPTGQENNTFVAFRQNAEKNRYDNILCPDKSRVRLANNFYYHGNMTTLGGLDLIICQAPNDASKSDFLKMLIEKNIGIVVMLCRVLERGVEKCYSYFDQDFGSADVGDYVVSTLHKSFAIDGKEDLIKRVLKIEQKSSKIRHQVLHFQFVTWRDHRDHKVTGSLIYLVEQILKQKQRIAVHCSAGCGRSGVIISTSICVNLFLQQKFDSVFKVLKALRDARPGIVQNVFQYAMVHKLIVETIEKRLLLDLSDIKRQMEIEFNQLVQK